MKTIALDLGQLLGGGGRPDEEDGSDAHRAHEAQMQAEMRREAGEDPAIYCRKLIDLATDYHGRPLGRFKVGDLIQAVPGSTYRFFTEKRPGLVVEVIDEVLFDDTERCSSPLYRQQLDLKIAIIRGGEFMVFHVCSRHFEKYTGPVFDS